MAKRVNPKTRIEMYLRHTVAVLNEHQSVIQGGIVDEVLESSSAASVMLNSLLRNELQDRLAQVLDDPPFPVRIFDYRGPETGVLSREHVVPLGQIIKLLKEKPHYGHSVTNLKALLSRSLLIAWVPSDLNKKLGGQLRSGFPKHVGSKWYQELTSEFTEEHRQDALWSRYIAIGEVRPGKPGSHFVELRTQKAVD